jgi:hypothetical protein
MAVCPALKEGYQKPKPTEAMSVSATDRLKAKAKAREILPGLIDTTDVPRELVASVVDETQASFRLLKKPKAVQSSPPAPRFIMPIVMCSPRQDISTEDVCYHCTMLSFLLTFLT